MNGHRFASSVFALLVFGGALSLAAIPARAADAPPKPANAPAPPPPPARPPQRKPPTAAEKSESYYKNIQAFKGVPADQLIPAMQFMSASLGVDCEFCHVDQAPDKDDKEEKITAREMIQMTAAINKSNFEGHQEVTCFSCHRGESRPVAVPAVATSDEHAAEEEEAAPAPPAARPSVDAVLEKYLKAAGGSAALEKVSSRVWKGTISGLAAEPLPVEISAKAPDKRVSVVKTPFGESITAFSGKSGWVGGTGRPARPMSDAENQAARVDAAFRLPSQLKQLFEDVRVARPGKIDGKEAVRLVGRIEGKPPVEFWFAADTGLLLRTLRYEQTPVGRNPTQTDFADYRAVDGVKLPYQWTIARPGGRFTIKVSEIKQNVPVDDAKFQPPDAP